MVEVAGQRFHFFQSGPDYAFIQSNHTGCGACYPLSRILVPAHRSSDQRAYKSLQGRPEVGPLPTPRRYHIIPKICPGMIAGFTDVSPVFTLPSRAEATLNDRTRVREPSTVRSHVRRHRLRFAPLSAP